MSADRVGGQGQLPLLDKAQVGTSHLELCLHHAQRLLVVRERLRQNLFAVAGGDLGGERALDFAEGAQADRGILGDRLLLFGGADIDLRLERAALVNRREQARAEAPDGLS